MKDKYKPAKLRNVTPIRNGKIGIGFDCEAETKRILIDVQDVEVMFREMENYRLGSRVESDA